MFRVTEINFVAILCDQESFVDNITEASLVVGNLGDVVITFGVCTDVIVVGAHRECQAIVVTEVAEVTGLNWMVPFELVDRSQIVGETFHVITGQQLLMNVQVFLAAVNLVHFGVLEVQPESIIHLEEVVVCVQANIFSEVRQFVVLVHLVIVVQVIVIHGVHVSLILVDDVSFFCAVFVVFVSLDLSVHLVIDALSDQFTAEELEWHNLIW